MSYILYKRIYAKAKDFQLYSKYIMFYILWNGSCISYTTYLLYYILTLYLFSFLTNISIVYELHNFYVGEIQATLQLRIADKTINNVLKIECDDAVAGRV